MPNTESDTPLTVVWLPIEQAPRDGTPLWLWNDEWEDEDFNPTGVVEGYWDENYDGPSPCWVVAGWNSCHDCYDSFRAEPSHFALKVPPANPANQGQRP